MPLTQEHRSSIYRSLTPILGAEETSALLSQFPSDERDELVTRGMLQATEANVRVEIAELRTELRTEVAELRTELHVSLRQQTIWFSSAMFASVGLAATIASLI